VPGEEDEDGGGDGLGDGDGGAGADWSSASARARITASFYVCMIGRMTSVLAAFALAAAAAAARPADVYFEQKTVPYADGKPAGEGVVTRVWYGGRNMRMEAGGAAPAPALILRLDDGKAWRLDPAEKKAYVMSADRLRARSQLDVATAADLMGATPDTRVKTEALPGERTIAGHKCQGFRVSGGTVVMDLWVTSALPVGVETFAGFLEWSGASDSLGPLLGEVRKLPGFPLQSRSRVSVMGVTQETVATVTKVKVGAHPPGTFDPPAGWTVEQEDWP